MSVQQRFSRIDPALAERLYRDAKAERWRLPQAAFTAALETSCAKAFRGRRARRRASSRGIWLRFIWRISRSPAHVRSATAQPGITSCSRCARRSTARQTRSIDRAARASWPTRSMRTCTASTSAAERASRCCVTFTAAAASPRGCVPFSRSVMSIACASSGVLSRCRRNCQPRGAGGRAIRTARALSRCFATGLEMAMARLEPRDRLRLGCYYAQQLTLAQTGKLLKEHEATTSRQLARTRKRIRGGVEQDLRAAWIERRSDCAVFRVRDRRRWGDESGRDARRTVGLTPYATDAQEIVTGSFNMKRDPMGHEPDRNDWLGNTLRQLARGVARRLS